MTAKILTVGHSNYEISDFISLLKQNCVEAIADVRSSPYSRFAPQFNTDALKEALRNSNIAYVFLGKELGARSDDDCCYVDDVVSYTRLARTELFRSGIQRLISGSEKFRIAAMCSEKEPTECHRTILVARFLSQQGVEVAHILGDGSIELHEQTMLRLLDVLDLPRYDLLMDTAALVEAAYEQREKQIAYRRKRTA